MPLISTSGSKPEYPVMVATFSQEKERRAFSSLQSSATTCFGQCIRERDILHTRDRNRLLQTGRIHGSSGSGLPNMARGIELLVPSPRPAVQYGCGLVVSGCHSFVVNIVGVINLIAGHSLKEYGKLESFIRQVIASLRRTNWDWDCQSQCGHSSLMTPSLFKSLKRISPGSAPGCTACAIHFRPVLEQVHPSRSRRRH